MAGSNGEPKPRHHVLTVFSAAISPYRIKTECPLSALSGHRLVRCTCLLLPQSGHSKGIKREDDPHLF